MDPRVFSILQFAHKFAMNLGMPNYFGLDRTMLSQPRERSEAVFTLDPSLYYAEPKKLPTELTQEGDPDDFARAEK